MIFDVDVLIQLAVSDEPFRNALLPLLPPGQQTLDDLVSMVSSVPAAPSDAGRVVAWHRKRTRCLVRITRSFDRLSCARPSTR